MNSRYLTNAGLTIAGAFLVVGAALAATARAPWLAGRRRDARLHARVI
jgi:hypothetical protein